MSSFNSSADQAPSENPSMSGPGAGSPGMSEGQPSMPHASSTPPPTPAASRPPMFSASFADTESGGLSAGGGRPVDIANLAAMQRRVLITFLALLGLNIGTRVLGAMEMMPALLALPLALVGLVGAVAFLVFVFQFCRAYGLNTGLSVLCTVAMIVPLVNLVVLALLVINSSKMLKSAGAKVGVLGVSPAAIAEMRQAA